MEMPINTPAAAWPAVRAQLNVLALGNRHARVTLTAADNLAKRGRLVAAYRLARNCVRYLADRAQSEAG